MIARFAILLLINAAFAGAATLARAGELYSYVDSEGVAHFSNVPTDGRYKRVARQSEISAGVYKITLRGKKASDRGAPSAKLALATLEDPLKTAADKYKLPIALLKAVMAVESNFNPRAVSEKGASGLMQLMPGTAKDMYVDDVYDPNQNIEGGARYLRILANQYQGDMIRTLAAYNAGPDAVRRAGGGVPDIPETRDYVRKVMALYEDYKSR